MEPNSGDETRTGLNQLGKQARNWFLAIPVTGIVLILAWRQGLQVQVQITSGGLGAATAIGALIAGESRRRRRHRH
ncbi:hypothetical protein ACIBL6_47540 [Streptomyces sp. NPDC050400]|uniref:hypothetical protein n=1 Tax=Streptomyces sp. NPDC050400 TaxID=3365610 RepID=UPI0037B912B8